MPEQDIIEKIKKSGLRGRSGSGFPTGLKWELVKKAAGKTKYVICNASEGEPLVFKDRYILKNFPEEVINGVKIAITALQAKRTYIYINKDYYATFGKTLKKLIGNSPIELFKKQPGYLRGEETVLLNVIEGKPPLPRIKPPFPTQAGLFGKPTLINNIETFWAVSKIAKGEYKKTRFYSVSGDAPLKGVFELPETLSVKEILEQTTNPEGRQASYGAGYQLPTPKESRLRRDPTGQATNYFYQIGGGASGEVLLASELNQPVKGLAAIVIYNKTKTDPLGLMKKWADFFAKENCDRCAPCREGVYRIAEILKQPQPLTQENLKTLNEIFAAMEQTSLCPLGRIAPTPFKSALAKLLK